MNKLEIKLKQHTPLIHFQWEQEEVTLRATEVKPKLDKFIIQKLGDKVQKHWFIGKHKALNYKMRIECRDKTEYLITSNTLGGKKEWMDSFQHNDIFVISGAPYFADESAVKSLAKEPGKWRDPALYMGKKGIMWDNIYVTLFSVDGSLLDKIKDWIRVFFICENFGTRQSKGFGSFSVVGIKTDKGFEPFILKEEDVNKYLYENFDFVYKWKDSNSPLWKIFKQIQNDYQLIKSGFNNPYGDPSSYKKSEIFYYGIKNKERWEKRFIKKGINKNINLLGRNIELYYSKEPITGEEKPKNSWEDKPDFYRYKYWRAVLGVAEHFEFLINSKQNEKDKYGKIKPDQDKIIVRFKSSDVERYRSPLLFKVINGTFYIVGHDDRLLNGKVFSFEFYLKNNDKQKIPLYVTNDKDEKIEQLNVPEDFSLSDFMRFVMEENPEGTVKMNYKKIEYE